MADKPKASKKIDPRALRRKLGMNQQKFWTRFGVTQSGGSRYESGRAMPTPVVRLLEIATAKDPAALIAKLREDIAK